MIDRAGVINENSDLTQGVAKVDAAAAAADVVLAACFFDASKASMPTRIQNTKTKHEWPLQ
jgi:hypothetical protein